MKFEFFEEGIVLTPDWQRTSPIAAPNNHVLFISLGCTLENLIIATRNLGYLPMYKYALRSILSKRENC
ncbi:MAG: hypothetical protein ACK4HE_00230 [Chitinophagaceae bacterium]